MIYWVGVKRNLRYLLGMVTMWPCSYNSVTSHTGLASDSDTDYAEDEDNKSTCEIFIIYRDSTVQWRLKNHTLTAIFTSKAEINSVTLEIVKDSWVRDIVEEPIGQSYSELSDLILVNDKQTCWRTWIEHHTSLKTGILTENSTGFDKKLGTDQPVWDINPQTQCRPADRQTKFLD